MSERAALSSSVRELKMADLKALVLQSANTDYSQIGTADILICGSGIKSSTGAGSLAIDTDGTTGQSINVGVGGTQTNQTIQIGQNGSGNVVNVGGSSGINATVNVWAELRAKGSVVFGDGSAENADTIAFDTTSAVVTSDGIPIAPDNGAGITYLFGKNPAAADTGHAGTAVGVKAGDAGTGNTGAGSHVHVVPGAPGGAGSAGFGSVVMGNVGAAESVDGYQILMDNGTTPDTSKPGIRYNDSLNTWQMKDDGAVPWVSIASGSGAVSPSTVQYTYLQGVGDGSWTEAWDVKLSNSDNRLIDVQQTANDTPGKNLTIRSGTGGDANTVGGGDGGGLTIRGGTGGAGVSTYSPGGGGTTTISGGFGGTGGTGDSSGGDLILTGGTENADGDGGNVIITGRQVGAGGINGIVAIQNDLQLSTANVLQLFRFKGNTDSILQVNPSAAGVRGYNLSIQGGNAGSGGTTGGDINIYSGSGDTGKSGDILLQVNAVGATRGAIRMYNADVYIGGATLGVKWDRTTNTFSTIGGAYIDLLTAGGHWLIGGGTVPTSVTHTALGVITAGPASNADSYHTHSLGGGTLTETAIENLAGGTNALNSLAGGNYNVAIGYDALTSVTTASSNTAFGASAGQGVTSSFNVAFGHDALAAGATGASNMAIGASTMSGAVVSGTYNIGIGNSAMVSLASGSNNVAIGWHAANTLTTGASNVAVGYGAMAFAGTGAGTCVAVGDTALRSQGSAATDSVGIGYRAGYGGTGVRTIAIGTDAAYTVRTSGDVIAIGHESQYVAPGTSGVAQNVSIGSYTLRNMTVNGCSGNVAVGYESLRNNQASPGMVAVGHQALKAWGTTHPTTAVSSYAVAMGYQAATLLDSPTTNNGNVAIGGYALSSAVNDAYTVAVGYMAARYFAMAGSTQGYNTIVGHESGMGASGATTAQHVTAIGAQSCRGVTTGGYNTAVGSQALRGTTVETNNTAVGYNAGFGISGAYWCVAVGSGALSSTVSGDHNVGVGVNVMVNGPVSGTHNVGIGTSTLADLTSGSQNIAIGYHAGFDTTTGGGSVLIGHEAGNLITGLSNYNVAIGYQAMYGNGTPLTPYDNVAIGYRSLYTVSDGYENIGIGTSAGASITTGFGNILVGCQAGQAAAAASQGLIAIGYQAAQNTSNTNAIYVGVFAGQNTNAAGDRNVGIGTSSLQCNSYAGGNNNTGVGFETLTDVTSGNYNTALGVSSGTAITSGSSNTAIGYQASLAVLTGGNNVSLGALAGGTLSTGSNNIYIGAATVASAAAAANEIVIGQGMTGKGSNTTLIKNPTLYLGATAAANVTIYAHNDQTPNFPYLRYDETGSKWVGNDGGGGGDYDLGGGVAVLTKYATVAACRADGAKTAGDICYVVETKTYYEYVSNVNDDDGFAFIHPTAEAGNLSWTAIAGRFGHCVLWRETTSIVENISTVVMGYGALTTNPNTYYSVDNAVVIGRNAMAGITGSADFNVVIGAYALDAATGPNSTIAIGFEAGSAMTSTYSENIFIGTQCAAQRTQGTRITAVGNIAANTGVANDITAIGYQAGRYATGLSGTFVGSFCGLGDAGGASGTYNTATGYYALPAFTTGQFNLCEGAYAGRYLTASSYNTAIGANAMSGATQTTGLLYITAVGYNAGVGVTGDYNTTVGASSMNGTITGANNTAIGYQAGNGIGTNGNTVAVGFNAGNTQLGANSIAVGHSAGTNTSCTAGVIVGYQAGQSATGANNVMVGAGAGTGAQGDGYVYIGYRAGYQADVTGDYNIGIGYQAHYGGGTYASGNHNVAIGYQTLFDVTSGSNNIAIGQLAGANITTVSELVAIGYQALTTATTGTTMEDCVAVGAHAMQLANAPSGTFATGYYRRNTAVGDSALYALTVTANDQANDDNTAIGNAALTGVVASSKRNTAVGSLTVATTTGAIDDTTAVGYNALNAATGSYNTAVGAYAGDAITSGTYNSCFGYGTDTGATVVRSVAIGYNSTCTYSESVAIGDAATTAGTQCISIGNGAASGGATDGLSIAIGDSADATNSFRSIAIGYSATSSGDESIAIGDAAVASVASAIAIGNGAIAQTGSGAIQLGAGTNSTSNEFQVGQSGGTTYIGRATSWNAYSDRRIKKNIEPMDESCGLEFIKRLNPVSFEFIRPGNEYHARPRFGLVAQDVKVAAEEAGIAPHGVYTDNEEQGWSVDYDMLVAPLIKAVQQLSETVESLQAQVAALKAAQ